MKIEKEDFLLYCITERSFKKDMPIGEQVEQAIKGGATMIQIREKNIGYNEYVELAKEVKIICEKHNIPFIVNDDVLVGKAVQADGVHVGQSDLDLPHVKELLDNNFCVGVSVATVEQAVLAEKQGANYLGVGAVFATTTKGDANSVSFDTLKSICNAVNIPVVAIGGINKENGIKLKGSNIAGLSVISCIFAQPDIKKAAEDMLKIAQEVCK